MNRLSMKPILLLFFFILPILSSYLYLSTERYLVKKAVKRMIINGMEEDQLIAFTFSAHDSAEVLQWKHAREFQFEGEMYDIVRFEFAGGDSTRYICWHDRDETRLNEQIASLLPTIFGHHEQTRQTKDRLYQFYTHLFYEYTSVELKPLNGSPLLLSSFDQLYSAYQPSVVSPPPQKFIV